MRLFTPVLVVLAALLAACTSSTASNPDPGYAVSIETQPAPMQSGRVATVSVRVNQPDGSPLRGAKVSFVPEHSGMSMSKPTMNAQEREPGVYATEYMPTMGGGYRVTVRVEGPAGTTEKVFDADVR